jgi:hypothetical protein
MSSPSHISAEAEWPPVVAYVECADRGLVMSFKIERNDSPIARAPFERLPDNFKGIPLTSKKFLSSDPTI